MTASDFLQAVDAIQEGKPTYRLGGKAEDGTCDCIGLVIGALARLGVKWPGIHGSNWAARNAMASLVPVEHAGDLKPGELVYKARGPGAAGYSLPSRYDGHADQRDYYHVGVVRSVEPLQIVHCTSPGGVTVDSKLGKWAYHGELKAVGTPSVTASGDTSLEEGGLVTEPLPSTEGGAKVSKGRPQSPLGAAAASSDRREDMPLATVKSANGQPVKLRAKPTRKSSLYWLVPSGSVVTVLFEGQAWWRVRYGGKTGYMMREYLERG